MRPSFEGAQAEGVSGAPWLPERRVLIALPSLDPPRVRVVESLTELLRGIDAAPVPTGSLGPTTAFDPPAGWDRDAAAYAAAATVPLARAGDVGSLRGLAVVPIVLRGARLGGGGLEIVTRLRVRVDFARAAPASPSRGIRPGRSDARWRAIRSSAIANWASARSFPSIQRAPGRLSATSALALTPLDESDRWLRLTIDHDAAYALGSADFSAAGVDPGRVDPASLRIFTGPRVPLDESIGADSTLFVEIPAMVEDDGDALFESGERLHFFAADVEAAPDEDETFGRPHPYARHNVYWVTWGWDLGGDPLRHAAADRVPTGGEIERTSARRIIHEELERLSPFSWGSAWYWDLQVGSGPITHTYGLTLPRTVPSGPLRLRVREIGATTSSSISNEHHVQIAFGEVSNTLGEAEWDLLSERIIEGEQQSGPSVEENDVLVTVLRDRDIGAYSDQLYLDWIEVEYEADLDAGGRGQWDFIVDRDSTDLPWLASVSGLFNAPEAIWDITDPLAPILLEGLATGSGVDLRFDGSTPRRIVVAAEPEAPAAIRAHTPARLRDPARGADWIAITSADLAPEAVRLADHRRALGLRATVVDIDDIYAEFSAGVPDPTALRDFLWAAYEGWSPPAPAYVLLLGDGTFDIKNNSEYEEHREIVPTHQTPAARYNSRVDALDGWFGQVDGEDTVQDIMIGRLTVRTREGAREVVDKIVRYESGADLGQWRMRAVLVADDEQNPDFGSFGESVHTRDSERLADQSIPDWLTTERIYLVDHRLNDLEKLTARDAIVDAFNEGMLVINYLGHGNHVQWAHENVLRSSRDIPLLENEGRWPLVLAGSCTVGRFDLDGDDSMAEEMTVAYERGGIAMVAATRPTYSDPNFRMMRTLMQKLFVENDRNAGLDLGSAHLGARLAEGNSRNEKLNHLFGDPAMQLALPRHHVLIDSISAPVAPVELVTISGRVVDSDSNLVSAGGTVDLIVRESAFDEVYTVPQSGLRIPFQRPGEMVYQGSVDLVGGHFEAELIAPRGFRSGDRGEIRAYAELSGGDDASGARGDLLFAGDPIRVDAVEAIHPIDAGEGAYAERPWGWSDSVLNRDSATGAPDGAAAEIETGAWLGLDFDDGPQEEIISDGAGDGSGHDLRVHLLGGASAAVFGSGDALDFRYLGIVQGTGEVALDDIVRKARYLRLFTTPPDTVSLDDEAPTIRGFAAGREIGPSGVTIGRGNPVTFVLDDEEGIALLAGVDRGLNLRLETIGTGGIIRDIEEFDLGPRFHYDRGSHRRGRAPFALDKPPGQYRLILSASDNTGARASTEVEVRIGTDLVLSDLRSYPNPFSKKAWITWKGSAQGEAKVKIYTVTGRLIRVLEGESDPMLEGYGFVEWDGTDEDRDRVANGVYLFRVELVSDGTKEKADGLGRIVVMR